MMSDLNMSYEKMSDFVSFPMFELTVFIKLRNFDFESHGIRLKYVPRKNV